eukprot:gene9789-1765_t
MRGRNLSVHIWAAATVSTLATDSGEATGSVVGTVTELNGHLVPCQLEIKMSNGSNAVAPNPAAPAGVRWTDGTFRVNGLPAGNTTIKVSAGFEYGAQTLQVTVPTTVPLRVAFKLSRSVDMRALGWFSLDAHDHMGWRLPSGNTTFWPGPSEQAAIEDRLAALSTPNTHLTYNFEARMYYQGDTKRCLGHQWTLGTQKYLPRSLSAQSSGQLFGSSQDQCHQPQLGNYEVHRLAHELESTVRISNEAKELPLDTVPPAPHLTKFVMACMKIIKHAHHQPTPGTYDLARLLVALATVGFALAVSLALSFCVCAVQTAQNNASFFVWMMLMDHGYRVAPTASTDACFDVPGKAYPGISRVYAYIRPPVQFSVSGLTEAVAAGHSFVSSGPLVLASVDGSPPGTSLPADGGHPYTLSLRVHAGGQDEGSLTRVEVWSNSQLWKLFSTGETRQWAVDVELSLPPANASRWYALRAFGSDLSQVAITGAFFLENGVAHSPPPPTWTSIQASVHDAHTGQLLPASLHEVEMIGPVLVETGRLHHAPAGSVQFSMPGTVRLTASCSGYANRTLSPLFDNSPLIEFVTNTVADDL